MGISLNPQEAADAVVADAIRIRASRDNPDKWGIHRTK